VKAALKEPSLPEVTVGGDVAFTVPSNLMVIVEESSKPVPTTVTDVPVFPLAGLNVIVGPRFITANKGND
jgi:hypothetical protein